MSVRRIRKGWIAGGTKLQIPSSGNHQTLEKEFSMLQKRVFFIAFILVLLAACGLKGVKVNSSDNNKSFDVKIDQLVVVQLEGNPSTGFTWEAKDLDAGLFQQVGEVDFKSARPGLMGSGGIQTLTFKALKAGSGKIALVYHRPWETDVAPANTFSITVNAK
jgi:inhibitor of cysteine peptidase